MSASLKKITFVLPGMITIPMGGVKIVNRLATLIAKQKYKVTLVYPMNLDLGFVHKTIVLIKSYLDKKHKVPEDLYYEPAADVDALVVKEISEKYIPDGDAIVAIGWQTAKAVNQLSSGKGEKFYFLQSYETYFSNPNKVLETYNLKLQKIALSKWILDEMIKLGQKSLGPVGNSIDPEEFYEVDTIEKTNDILMLYHPAGIKNAKFGLAVLDQLKKGNPELTATVYAAREPFHKIPPWVNLIIRPDIDELRRLYNQSKVFLSTSKWEGWGLPPMEAMACGCAVVAVKNKGVREFMRNNENGFLVQPKDKKDAVKKIKQLLKNDDLRKKFVQEGHKTLANYSEDEVVSTFINCLNHKG